MPTRFIFQNQLQKKLSQTLLKLLAQISPKLNEDSLTSIRIGNMTTCNVKKHPTPLQIALGVLFKSDKKILNHLSDYYVTCNYDEMRHFRKSAAINAVTEAQKTCPPEHVGGLLQVVSDNFDLDLHTPNVKAAAHSFAIIQTYPLSSHVYESEVGEIKRIKWKRMSNPISDD